MDCKVVVAEEKVNSAVKRKMTYKSKLSNRRRKLMDKTMAMMKRRGRGRGKGEREEVERIEQEEDAAGQA